MLDAEEIRILVHPESKGQGQQREDSLLRRGVTLQVFSFPFAGILQHPVLGEPLWFSSKNRGKELFSHY